MSEGGEGSPKNPVINNVEVNDRTFREQFTSEQRLLLTEKGFLILPIPNKSIDDYLREGARVSVNLRGKDTDIRQLKPKYAEAAFNPKKPCLPETVLGKTLLQEEQRVKEFYQKLGEEIPGVESVIGDTATYVGVGIQYSRIHGKHLLRGLNYYTITSDNVYVGRFPPIGRLHVTRLDRIDSSLLGRVAPLIVPASPRK